jgi:hypothetical protein
VDFHLLVLDYIGGIVFVNFWNVLSGNRYVWLILLLVSGLLTQIWTARQFVGDGSKPATGFNMSLLDFLASRKIRKTSKEPSEQSTSTSAVPLATQRTPLNPLASLKILLDRENALLLFYNALLFATFFGINASVPSQFGRTYNFNNLQIGLCFLPLGCGSLCAVQFNGRVLDRNFIRWCKRLNIPMKKGRNQDLADFPIERARLQVGIPASISAAIWTLIYGWLLDARVHFGKQIPVMFFLSFSMTCAFNSTATLLIDFYPKSAATAAAANNIMRCLLGAGATALIVPMIDAMTIGWTFTLLSSTLLITCLPTVGLVYLKGQRWRKQRLLRDKTACHTLGLARVS